MAVKSPVSILFNVDGQDVQVNANRLLTDTTVSGVVQVADNGGSLTVDGPLTDTELRASAVPISAASLPLPAGAATEATLSSFRTEFNNEDFAQEITQSGIKAELEAFHTSFNTEDFATETTLTAIKDTDGIKRIEDPLPSGTNFLGSVSIANGGDSVTINEGALAVEALPILYAVALGNVPGSTVWFGHTKVTLSQTTGVGHYILNEGTWVEQTSGAQRSFVSSSAQDSAAGTGARKIVLAYISSVDGTFKQEVITLNGTTAVNTVATDIEFVSGWQIIDSGSGQLSDGTISMYSTTGGGGSIIAQMLPGNSTTHAGAYKVPSNQTLWVTRIEYYLDNEAWFDLERTVDMSAYGGGSNQRDIFYHTYVDRTESGTGANLAIPIRINGGQIYRARVIDGGNGTTVAATSYGWLEAVES